MTHSKNDFLILYGSQTGQAQAISEEVFDRAHKEGFTPRRFCLSQVEKKFSLLKENCVVFVCSTTGEGDPPDTAGKFFRRLKKKTIPNDQLEHLKYAFLALGDSNYTNFCNFGKVLESRLSQLGAKHFYDTGYADDAVGLEVVVEPWIESLFPALRKHLGIAPMDIIIEDSIKITSNGDIQDQNKKIKSSIDLKDTSTNGNNFVKKTVKQQKTSENNIDHSVEVGVSTIYKSIGPISTAALKIPACHDAFLELRYVDEEVNNANKPSHPSEATNVFKVPIISARRLTHDPSVKKALELQLDVSNIDYGYQPGDSFGVVCQNRRSEVNYIIQRLGIEDIADQTITLEIIKNTKKKAPVVPEHLQLPSTIRKILTNDIDFRAVPRKAFFRMLVDYTEDPSEKRRLQELASVQGAKEYAAFVREQTVGVVELLKTFKSCLPPIQRLFEFLPILFPREYSVASSPLNVNKSMSFVFNVISFPDFANSKRFGLCTKYLDLLTHKLRSGHNQRDDEEEVLNNMQGLEINDVEPELEIYFRKPTHFRFPEDPTRPMIMIGPGTGVAPFIGFLQHRDHLKSANKNLALGRAVLFYGCRHEDKDFLYKEELNNFLESGVLNQIYTSFSRDSPSDDNHTKYVQENIRKVKQDLLDMIFKENGSVFVCGDAKHMGRDVTNTFVELVQEYKNVTKIEAFKLLDELRLTNQFLEDVWT